MTQGMQGALPRKLRLLRAERGLTLVEAAKKIGITRESLGLLEKGKRHPHAPTLTKLANGYGVPVEELFSLSEEEGQVSEEQAYPLAEAPSEPGPAVKGEVAQKERRTHTANQEAQSRRGLADLNAWT